jgi:hypothetical protein
MEASQTTLTRQRRNKEEVMGLLHAFEKSNSTIKEFCNERNISYGNFQKWRSRYGSKAAEKKASTPFVKVDIVSTVKEPLPGLFAEVRGIKLYQPVSAAFLKELLA